MLAFTVQPGGTITTAVTSCTWQYVALCMNNLPESGGVEHHDGHVLGGLVRGVVLHAPQQLLDQRMPGVDLQRLLLVQVVVPLHVLGLRVSLRLDDLLHVRRPAEPEDHDVGNIHHMELMSYLEVIRAHGEPTSLSEVSALRM